MSSLRSAWWGAWFVSALLFAVAVPATGEGGQRNGGGTVVGSAVPAASAPAPSPAPVGAPSAGSASASADRPSGGGRRDGGGARAGTATPRDSGARTSGGSGSRADAGGESQGGRNASTSRRTSRGGDVVGTAVRRSAPVRTGGDVVFVVPAGYGFYPWGYGGLGFGGYYGGYYSSYYDPWWYSGGGYAGGSWYGDDDDEGALRLKVTPREASVYVDGYLVGQVEDFNGVFQRLHLASGPHRIEIRQPDYEPLVFDVRIEEDETVTYRGELKKVQ